MSNKVLEHALEVKADIAKLRETVANTSMAHQDDVRKQEKAETRVEVAYQTRIDLADATKELAAVSADTCTSLRKSQAAKTALKDFDVREGAKASKARKGKVPK